MEIVCVSSSSKNKGKGTSDANPPAPFDPKRQKDWTVHETNVLIDVVQQYQSAHGVSGLSFSSTAWTELHKQFKAIIPDTIRDKGKLKNQMKVMRDKFVICYDLVDNKSGGHWDHVKQRPGAPSDAEYYEMVKAKGPKANFLLPSPTDPTKGTFPWYEQMRTMIGGQTSRGNATKPSWDYEGENSQHLPDSQWSARPSEQGSSDDGGDFPNNTEVSSPPRRSYSQRSQPVSQSSGSKRKSTDESAGEGNSTRKNC
ncbi:Myb/SANT-like domain-containing protein [Rhynchospora pubera]|uniref:Myb/SANT-like domain-containing protein n=1 Tax=Rhynchospora pubera TaxID=906938 RepID=A0AAV8DB72_9POAL|nr:Myb/SANT-like domain-containing protein [Rhynchospora pubera]